MSVGFVILAHERLDRVAALARHLCAHGAPVAIHVDRRIAEAERRTLSGETGAVFSTRDADWGRFGLVEASLDGVRAVLKLRPGIGHVCLLSGSCLPIRPLPVLIEHLRAHPDTDFIESVPIAEDRWVADGLSEERFTLWHPFSHRRHPRLFSAAVEVQRRLRVRRRIPEGLVPHLGLQWWCLSAATLHAILDDPRLGRWQRFFRHVWIPDESFFQTVVRVVRPGGPTRPSLHLNRFDPRGKPHVFHDDHLELLAGADSFLARKIDPDAEGLHRHFLGAAPDGLRAPVDEGPFRAARTREAGEGAGVLSPARYPGGTGASAVDTCRPYVVFVADDPALLGRLRERLRDMPGLVLHGRLFVPAGAEFAGGGDLAAGNIPASAAIRDRRPAQFLARLVRMNGDRPLAFFYALGDTAAVAGQIVGDGNARLVLIGEARRLMDALRAPPVGAARRRAPAPPREVWAWSRLIDPAAISADLEDRGCGAGLRAAGAVLGSDWTDQHGWTVPSGWKAPGTP